MIFLELLIEILSSFFDSVEPKSTDCSPSDAPEPSQKKDIKNRLTEIPKYKLKPGTISDMDDCAKAHAKIEKGEVKSITPFVKYTEVRNENNNRKTTAGQISIPLYNQIRGCITSKDQDKKSK